MYLSSYDTSGKRGGKWFFFSEDIIQLGHLLVASSWIDSVVLNQKLNAWCFQSTCSAEDDSLAFSHFLQGVRCTSD